MAEFAHVVYRFGHSMLTETVDRIDHVNGDDPTPTIGLIEAFLNPVGVRRERGDRAIDAAGDIVRGMTQQVGNEIDEFVTDALRNNLVGLPLDLATINMARGRDTGVPALNDGARHVLCGHRRQLRAAALRRAGPTSACHLRHPSR